MLQASSHVRRSIHPTPLLFPETPCLRSQFSLCIMTPGFPDWRHANKCNAHDVMLSAHAKSASKAAQILNDIARGRSIMTKIVLRRSFTVRMHVILRHRVTRSKSRCEPRRRGCDSLSLLAGASHILMAETKRALLAPGSMSLHFDPRRTRLSFV